MQNGCFRCIIVFCLKKVCYPVQSFFVWKLSATKLQGIHWPNYLCKNDWWGATTSTWNFGSNWPRWSEIADFQSVFACSTSTVTPIKKVQLTLIGSPLCAFQWAQDEHCTLSLSSPKGISKMQCPKFEQLAVITRKRYEIGCQFLLITNKKSYTGFRLVLTSMTLNGLERCNSPYFAFFLPNSIALQASYVTVVDVCKILSPGSSLTLCQNYHTLQRGLCDNWATCSDLWPKQPRCDWWTPLR